MRRIGMAMLILGLALGAGAIARAAIPDSNGTYTACALKPTGAMRVIDPGQGQSCSKNENRITFNQQGQQGVQGESGPPGIAGVHYVNGTAHDLARGTTWTAAAACPSGETLLGGGYFSSTPGIALVTSNQAWDIQGVGWEWLVAFTNPLSSPASVTVSAQAVCGLTG